jgi:hypothetical protein
MNPPASQPLCCWTLGGRPLLAYACGTRRQRVRAVDLFPRTTLKRRLWHEGIRLLAAAGLDRGLTARMDSAGALLPPGELELLLEELRHAGAHPAEWLVTWPARLERHRLYLVFRNAQTGRAGVVKIGAGAFNRAQFQNEAAVLQRLAAVPRPFMVPSVSFIREHPDGRCVLALGGFPPRLRAMSRAQAQAWSKRVMAQLATSAPGGLVHGDLGPGNMLVEGRDGLFLFDWENAATGAPPRVDEIGFWLSLRQARVLLHPQRAARELSRSFPHGPSSEVTAALDFLAARDNLAARRLREVWP